MRSPSRQSSSKLPSVSGCSRRAHDRPQQRKSIPCRFTIWAEGDVFLFRAPFGGDAPILVIIVRIALGGLGSGCGAVPALRSPRNADRGAASAVDRRRVEFHFSKPARTFSIALSRVSAMRNGAMTRSWRSITRPAHRLSGCEFPVACRSPSGAGQSRAACRLCVTPPIEALSRE